MEQVEINEEKPVEVKETETVVLESSKQSNNGSECDAGDSGSEGEFHSERRRPENSNSESDTDSVIQEREEGDGQESVPSKKVDDDEDKKNPQYIPKRGTFYEHDDRTADDSEAVTEVEKSEKETKKKVWQDRKERWSHDRYNDNEQAPKSRAELIAIYGYDIRNEDGPPRARRRRRYGRGPNKYTRNWEDEDAYTKPPPSVRKTIKKGKNKSEEFPPLTRDAEHKDENDSIDVNAEESSNSGNERSASASETNNNRSKQENYKSSSPDKEKNKKAGTGRIVKPKKDVQELGYRGFTKARQYKNSKIEQKIIPKKRQDQEDVQNGSKISTSQSVKDVEREMNKLNIQDGVSKNSKHANNQRQNSVPPRLQVEQKSSKRYSSLRQRSLPETASANFNNHTNYFSNDFNSANQSNQQQGMLQQNAIHPTTTQVPQIPPPPLPPIPQVPVTATPILQAPPPQYPPPFPQPPPAFLQPGVAPPAFIPPQTPQLINYVQGQPQFQQGPYQGYQQQFNPVNQPAELYQPQGGITYYSAQDQQATVRMAPQKRPKAAIPIVPPPPTEPRGRGRSNNNSVPSPNSADINQDSNKQQMESEQNCEDAPVMVQQ